MPTTKYSYINSKMNENSWTLIVKEDAETKDLVLELPRELMEKVGWNIGDTLEWSNEENETWQLKKVK